MLQDFGSFGRRGAVDLAPRILYDPPSVTIQTEFSSILSSVRHDECE